MTEREYIDATNLARLRIVQTILRGMIGATAKEGKRRDTLAGAVAQWTLELENKVATTE